jgi:ADP-ribose pyrophosphatase YjhB (NUDIX family)
MLGMWRKISSKKLFTHPRLKVSEDTVLLSSGQEAKYLIYDQVLDAAGVLAIDGDKILVVKEYSYPQGEFIYQFPIGFLNLDETPIIGASRELREETGLISKNLETLGSFFLENRRTNAKVHAFVCRQFDKGEPDLDPEEAFEYHWLSLEEINALIKSSELQQKDSLAIWALYLASL